MAKFTKNDLVFAKVKGYPAWPAIITEYNIKNKKYEVKFYGTGETGNIREEDLRYYLQSKEELSGKAAKRKDYLDALTEIEKAFRKIKTDGNGITDLDKELVKIKKEMPLKLSTKRKSVLESENATPKRIGGKRKAITAETTNNDIDKEDVIEDRPLKNIKLDQNDEEQKEIVHSEAVNNSTCKSRSGRRFKSSRTSTYDEITSSTLKKTAKTPKAKATKSTELKKPVLDDLQDGTPDSEVVYSVVPIENLDILLKYFDAIKDKEEAFKKRAPEDLPPPSENAQVVLVVAPEKATLFGIRYHEKNMPKFCNEYDRASYEAKEARRVINLKSEIESGVKNIEKDSNFYIPLEGKNTENVRNSILEKFLCQKRKKLKFLQIENSLLNCDCSIKSSLGLDKVDPKLALEHLEIMTSLPVEPLMLIKHPQVFEMVKKLQRYVGNVQYWNLDQDETDKFAETAKKIRIQADQVFHKFMVLMLKVLPSRGQINNTIFWTVFMEEVQRFQKVTSHLRESEIFVLSAEPCSRASILDSLYQEHATILQKSFIEPTLAAADSSTSVAEGIKSD